MPAGLYAMALAKMSSTSRTNASQLWYLPSRMFSRSVRKSIGVATTEKYPGAIASVTGSANTPCLSLACSFLVTSSIALGLGGGSTNAGTGPGTKPFEARSSDAAASRARLCVPRLDAVGVASSPSPHESYPESIAAAAAAPAEAAPIPPPGLETSLIFTPGKPGTAPAPAGSAS